MLHCLPASLLCSGNACTIAAKALAGKIYFSAWTSGQQSLRCHVPQLPTQLGCVLDLWVLANVWLLQRDMLLTSASHGRQKIARALSLVSLGLLLHCWSHLHVSSRSFLSWCLHSSI